MPDYPKSCLRGIRKRDFLIANSEVVLQQAFQPDPRTQREDGFIDTSIDWEDDETTISITQKNNNSQFGVIRLLRTHIDEVIVDNEERDDTRGALAYERQAIEGNPHHGNILFKRDIPKPLINMLAATLALRSRVVFLKP